jgi:ABC-type dipeptide/oligopeptide/nickel transport system ATPase component
VDGVDLRVEPGEIYGFLGPNGAGKTTTVRMLVTLLSPTAGRATVAGRDIFAEPHEVRLRIGVALQGAALDAQQTGAEILRLQGRLYGLTAGETKRRLAGLGELIDLGDALDRRVGGYSGGSAAASTTPPPSSTTPTSSFSTSRRAVSTPSAARRSGRRSAASTTSSASPSSLPPSTLKRRTVSPTGSASSTGGA